MPKIARYQKAAIMKRDLPREISEAPGLDGAYLRGHLHTLPFAALERLAEVLADYGMRRAREAEQDATRYSITGRDSLKVKDFVEQIARLTKDGEELRDEDGQPYEFILENDDAISTLHSLIDAARELVKEGK